MLHVPADSLLSPGHLRCRLRLRGQQILEQGFQTLGATPRASLGIIGLRDLRHADERELHQQPLVAALPVVDVALVDDLQTLVQERRRAFLRLLLIALPLPLAHLEQAQRLGVACHHHVAHGEASPLTTLPASKP